MVGFVLRLRVDVRAQRVSGGGEGCMAESRATEAWGHDPLLRPRCERRGCEGWGDARLVEPGHDVYLCLDCADDLVQRWGAELIDPWVAARIAAARA